MKLHGSICYVNGKSFSHDKMFAPKITERIPTTFAGYDKTEVPPIVFPWELFDQAGNFIFERDFIFTKQAKTDEEKTAAKVLFNLYEAIWQRARMSVQRASKISFVGLSFHEYVKQGLNYLFKDKAGIVNFVIANPNEPENLGSRLSALLRQSAPAMQARGSWIEPQANKLDNFGRTEYMNYGMTIRASF